MAPSSARYAVTLQYRSLAEIASAGHFLLHLRHRSAISIFMREDGSGSIALPSASVDVMVSPA